MENTIQAVIFDVFGTLVDWRTGVARHVQPFLHKRGIAMDPFAFADAWRAEYQPSMQAVRAGNRGFVRLEILHAENLTAILQRFGHDGAFEAAELEEMNRAWERLPAWDDVVPGLDELRENLLLAPCSNGSIGMMARLARFAGLTWDAILGAEIAREYKPRPQVYHRSVEALGLTPENVVMAAAHNEDLEAAAACGLQTAFIARPDEFGPDAQGEFSPTGNWDYVADSLPELAEKIGRSRA